MKTIFGKLLYEQEKGNDTVLVTIVSDRGSAPRGAGSMMLVGAGGRILGTIGGGAVEKRSEELALTLLGEKRSLMHEFRLNTNDVENIGMVCGGDVSVLFRFIAADDAAWNELIREAVGLMERREAGYLTLGENVASLSDCAEGLIRLLLPLGERAVIFGGGHIAAALAPLLGKVGFRTVIFDDRAEYSNPARFPSAERCIRGDFSDISVSLELEPEDYIVVMTNGHSHDMEVQAQVLRAPAAYVGVIGSRSKTAAVNAKLRELGISDEALSIVHTPIGTSIKAVTPEEIAVSIAGEMIYVRAALREGEAHISHL